MKDFSRHYRNTYKSYHFQKRTEDKMSDTHLFLVGGGPPFTGELGEPFVNLAGSEPHLYE